MYGILTICNEICIYTSIWLRLYFAILYRCQYLFHVLIFCLRIMPSQILENITYFNNGCTCGSPFHLRRLIITSSNVHKTMHFFYYCKMFFFVYVNINYFKTNIYEFTPNNMCLVEYWETSNVNPVLQINMLYNLSVGLL